MKNCKKQQDSFKYNMMRNSNYGTAGYCCKVQNLGIQFGLKKFGPLFRAFVILEIQSFCKYVYK